MGTFRIIACDPVLRLAAFAIFAFATGIASMAPYVSLVALQELRLGDGTFAAIWAAGAAVAVVASVALGVLTDRLNNRRQVAVVAAGLWTLGGALVFLHPSGATYAVAHALLLPAGSSLFGQIFVLARVAARHHAEREAILAAIRAAFALPFILVLPLWSFAVAQGAPLVSVYAVLAASGLAATIAILRSWPRHQERPPTAPPGFLAALAEMARPGIPSRLIAVGLTKSSIALYMVVLGPILTAAGHSEAEVGIFAALVAGFEIPVMLAIGHALRRTTKARLIAAATLVHAIFMAAIGVLAGSAAVWVLPLVAAVGAGVILSVPIGYIQDLMDDRPGAGGGLIAIHQFAGEVFMVCLFAAGSWLGGYSLAALFGAIATLTGGAMLLRLDRARPAFSAS